MSRRKAKRDRDRAPHYVICWEWDAPGPKAPGSMREHCTVCRVAVSLSPSAFTVAMTVPVVCHSCGIERMRTTGSTEVMPVSPAQVAEVRAAGIDASPAELDRVMARHIQRWVKGAS